MGKSKRIRAERARAIAANPEKHVKNNASKKSTLITVVIVAVILALVIGVAAPVVLMSTGSIIRWQTAYSSENYSISGAMMAYLYQTQYQYMYSLYYTYMGSSIGNYISSIQTSSENQAKLQAEQIIKLCEAARAAGVVLDDEDKADIDEAIKNIEENAKEAGMSISAMYGNLGINISDIRAVIELSTLASKYQEIKTDELEAGVKDDEEAIKKFIAEHMSLFYKADYLTYTSDTKSVVEAFQTLKDTKDFKTEVIRLTVENKYSSEFTSAATKIKPEHRPVKALETAIKAAILAELKYSLLEIEIEGLELKDVTARKDRIKAIFEKLYEGQTFAAGEGDDAAKANGTTISAELYTVLGTVGDKLYSSANTAATNAEKLEQAYTLPDLADEKEESDSDDKKDEDKPTEAELWLFADERKAGDATVITNTTKKDDGTTTESYTVYVMVKPNYLDEEITKDVGHILLKVETKTAGSSATAEEKKEIEEANNKAYEDKKPTAEEILASVTGKTKDEFEAIAKEKTEDSSVFYENVHTGDMVQEFEDWLFSSERKVGETGLVKTEYGWHIMYFVGDGLPAWKADGITEYVNDAYSKWYEALPYKVTVNDTTIDNVCS